MSKSLTKNFPQPKFDIVSNLDTKMDGLVSGYSKLKQLANATTNQAIYFGQLLIETKEAYKHKEFGAVLKSHWHLFEPEGTDTDFDSFWRRCNRWMEVARAVTGALHLHSFIELDKPLDGTKQIPLSVVLSSNAAELPKEAADAQQLIFDFTEGKTMKECLEGVVVDGDEPHRITRAHNGKTKGGTRGENRKDWPLYFGENLNGALAHAKHWPAFSATQKHEAEKFTKLFLGSIPEELLTFLTEAVSEESKARKKGKLAQPEQLGFAIKERKEKE